MHSTDLKKLIQGIPKAELHLHIEGSFEPELMFEIAKRNKVRPPSKSSTRMAAGAEQRRPNNPTTRRVGRAESGCGLLDRPGAATKKTPARPRLERGHRSGRSQQMDKRRHERNHGSSKERSAQSGGEALGELEPRRAHHGTRGERSAHESDIQTQANQCGMQLHHPTRCRRMRAMP